MYRASTRAFKIMMVLPIEKRIAIASTVLFLVGAVIATGLLVLRVWRSYSGGNWWLSAWESFYLANSGLLIWAALIILGLGSASRWLLQESVNQEWIHPDDQRLTLCMMQFWMGVSWAMIFCFAVTGLAHWLQSDIL
jgi:hypothetical protein